MALEPVESNATAVTISMSAIYNLTLETQSEIRSVDSKVDNLSLKVDNLDEKVEEVKNSVGNKQLDHETRIRALEKLVYKAAGAAAVLGAAISIIVDYMIGHN